MGLTDNWFNLLGQDLSARDLILIVGGIFLLTKSTHEIHKNIEGEESDSPSELIAAGFGATLIQIAIFDIVFSLDSVITAVGMASHVPVKILAIVIAVLIGEGLDMHIPKGYIYFAMAFSVAVEMLNLRHRKKPSRLITG
jgi:predicted tellurium resistance membrane protein TerC